MSLNPVAYTEKVVSDFLKYQLTTYAFADPKLYEQMRTLLSLEHTRDTPLLKGPFVSLSRAFRTGSAVHDQQPQRQPAGLRAVRAHPHRWRGVVGSHHHLRCRSLGAQSRLREEDIVPKPVLET